MAASRANILVDGLVHQMHCAGFDMNDVAAALLIAASRIAQETIGADGWARALEKASAVALAPDVSREVQ